MFRKHFKLVNLLLYAIFKYIRRKFYNNISKLSFEAISDKLDIQIVLNYEKIHEWFCSTCNQTELFESQCKLMCIIEFIQNYIHLGFHLHTSLKSIVIVKGEYSVLLGPKRKKGTRKSFNTNKSTYQSHENNLLQKALHSIDTYSQIILFITLFRLIEIGCNVVEYLLYVFDG